MEYRKISKLKARIKQGDKNAFDELVKHYEDYFVNIVIKNNNNDETLKEDAKEKLPVLLQKYFDDNYEQAIYNYLTYYSKSSFIDKKRLSDTRGMDLNNLKEIYTKRLFSFFENINSVLTKEELYNYVFNLISETIDDFSKDRETLATKLGIFFSRQKRFIKEEETLLIRYILQEGCNDNIVTYFENKYKNILNEYRTEVSYTYLNKNFKNIIKEILNEINSSKTSVQSIIRKNIHRIHLDYSKDIVNVGNNIRNDNTRIDELYESNLVLKDRVYEYYKDKVNVPEEKMHEIIDKNYDIYFNAYINGVCAKPLSAYILTRFSEYFNKIKLPRVLTNEELEEMQLIYFENENMVDKKMKKNNLNYPSALVKKELIESYDESIETYFRKENKTEPRIIIAYWLNKKIEELNKLYSDSAILDSSIMMKKGIILNKINNSNILDEIMGNLTEYYLSNKMENEKPFELFIIDAIENFDLEEYLMIKDIKEHINLKVLKHPSMK